MFGRTAQRLRRLGYSVRRNKLDRELHEEMQAHIEEKITTLRADGVPPEEARQRAIREFGNPALLHEHSRAYWGWHWIDSAAADLRYALRTLRNNPTFTAIAVMTLAIGIGANTAVFTVVNAVLVKPLPYAAPERLVRVDRSIDYGTVRVMGIKAEHLELVRSGNHTLEDIFGYTQGTAVLSGVRAPVRIVTCTATPNIFTVLGAAPVRGRGFLAAESTPGRDQVAVISYGLWQRAFGGQDVLGRTVELDARSYTIIGIAPRDFDFPIKNQGTQVWLPLVPGAGTILGRPASSVSTIARLKPGVTPTEAVADLKVVMARLPEKAFAKSSGTTVEVTPLREYFIGNVRKPLLMLSAAVALVLFIAGTNLAGLLLARGSARTREIAIRNALGATRWRIAQQLLLEALVIAAAGGALGLVLAAWTQRALVALRPADLPHIGAIQIDGSVMLFDVAISVVSALVFALAPGLRLKVPNLNEFLKQGATKSPTRRSRLARRCLIAAETGLALVLLSGAGLMIRTMVKLYDIDPGFPTERLISGTTTLPAAKYQKPMQQSQFFDQVIDDLRAQPNVASAAATSILPMSGPDNMFMGKTASGELLPLRFRSVSPDYFRTLGIVVTKGRGIAATDSATSGPVVVLNEAAVTTLFGKQDPVGKPLEGFGKTTLQVIGVVRDIRTDGLDLEAQPEIYLPMAQHPMASMHIVARVQGDPRAAVSILRDAVRLVDRDEPVDDIRTMDEVIGTSTSERRFYMVLLTVFAAIALALGVIGVYGLVAYDTAQRSHEIAVRIALGADRERIFRWIIGQGLAPALAGLVLGILGALAAARLLTTLLYGVSSADALTFTLGPALLFIAAVLACLRPAIRATRITPATALRYE